MDSTGFSAGIVEYAYFGIPGQAYRRRLGSPTRRYEGARGHDAIDAATNGSLTNQIDAYDTRRAEAGGRDVISCLHIDLSPLPIDIPPLIIHISGAAIDLSGPLITRS